MALCKDLPGLRVGYEFGIRGSVECVIHTYIYELTISDRDGRDLE